MQDKSLILSPILRVQEITGLIIGELCFNSPEYDFASEEELDNWEKYKKEVIISLLPNDEVYLNSLGGVISELDNKRNILIRLFDFLIVENYLILILFPLKKIFKIKKPFFVEHYNRIIRYFYREDNRAFQAELKKDNISVIDDDDEAGYFFKLPKNLLIKYLDEGFFDVKKDIIFIPKKNDDLLTYQELKCLQYIESVTNKFNLPMIEKIMQKQIFIGAYVEDIFFFIIQKDVKQEILDKISRFGKVEKINIT